MLCGCHCKMMWGVYSSRYAVASLSRLYDSHKLSGPCPFVKFFYGQPKFAFKSQDFFWLIFWLTKQCLTKHNSSYQPAEITGIWVSHRSSPRCWDPPFFAFVFATETYGSFDQPPMPIDKSPDPANCDSHKRAECLRWPPHPFDLSP